MTAQHRVLFSVPGQYMGPFTGQPHVTMTDSLSRQLMQFTDDMTRVLTVADWDWIQKGRLSVSMPDGSVNPSAPPTSSVEAYFAEELAQRKKFQEEKEKIAFAEAELTGASASQVRDEINRERAKRLIERPDAFVTKTIADRHTRDLGDRLVQEMRGAVAAVASAPMGGSGGAASGSSAGVGPKRQHVAPQATPAVPTTPARPIGSAAARAGAGLPPPTPFETMDPRAQAALKQQFERMLTPQAYDVAPRTGGVGVGKDRTRESLGNLYFRVVGHDATGMQYHSLWRAVNAALSTV